MPKLKKQKCNKCGKFGETLDGLCLDCCILNELANYDANNPKKEAAKYVAGIKDNESCSVSLGAGNYYTRNRVSKW